MRSIRLYIATSLDGYIARPDGSVDWLESFPNPDQNDYGYQAFLNEVDTTLMGRATYQEILNFGIAFPYADKVNYVFTRQTGLPDTEFVQFVSTDVVPFIQQLKKTSGKDIWLIGGGQLNTLLLQHDLLDEMIITIVPLALGKGIPLFAPSTLEKQMVLTENQTFKSGFVQLIYQRADS